MVAGWGQDVWPLASCVAGITEVGQGLITVWWAGEQELGGGDIS
jgi:hypothetical protein